MGYKKNVESKNQETVSADHPGPPNMRPFFISFSNRSRHFASASFVLRKFDTGVPGLGSLPQSPHKPPANIDKTAFLDGSGIRNLAFNRNISGLRKFGSSFYIGGESAQPDKHITQHLGFAPPEI